MNNIIQSNPSTIHKIVPSKQSSLFQKSLLLLPCKLLALLFLFTLSSTVSASMAQFINMGGKITLSTDGCSAQNRADLVFRSGIRQYSTCSITIKKPAGATVKKVILLAAADVQQSRAPQAEPIALKIKKSSFQPNLSNLTSFHTGGLTSFVRYGDVTSQLQTALNGLATGNNTLQLTEAGNRSLEGMQMFVIWNDPNTAETVIGINLGTVNTYSGVNGSIRTLPIDTSKPDFKVTSGTSIAYSTEIKQSPDWLPQVSTLRLNGVVFATQAGGYDDGVLVNGGLFTAGGEGDSVSANSQDELYNASPAVMNGATALTYSTNVPSGHIYDWMVAMWIEAKGVEKAANSISGTVYQDHDNNGKQDNGETGIEGISISLYDDTNKNGAIDVGDTIVKTSESDANGHYTFNADNGSYLIQVDEADTDLPTDSSLRGANPLDITVNNTAVPNQDFPFIVSSIPEVGQCIDTSSNANTFISYYASGLPNQPSNSLHPNAYNFRIENSLYAAGFCAEKSDKDPKYNDTYSAHTDTRQRLSDKTVDYLARALKGLQDPQVTQPIFTAFPRDKSILDSLYQHIVWYYTDWGQDYSKVQDAIDYRANANSFSAKQKQVFERITTLVINRSKGLNGETQYAPDEVYWLYNETNSGRQDIIIPSVYVYGNNCEEDKNKLPITGTAYLDSNSNNTQDGTDTGIKDISVSLYKDINKNGLIDTEETAIETQDTDADGHYTFNVKGGSYLIQINSHDTDIPESTSLSGTNPLTVTITSSAVSGQDFPFAPSSCTALSGNINNALSPNLQLRNNEKLFLASTTITPKVEGHLKAYTVNSSGIIVTPSTADWDLASTMTQIKRQSTLYSTNTLGAKALFNSLDEAAFAVNGLPSVASIKSYTLNPSFNHPLYIGNRKQNSLLGAISTNNNLALITRNMDILRYLNDSDYQGYNATVISTRTKRVLTSSDDGFLYAADQSNGGLGWGWIPRTLVKELYNNTDFPSQHFMHGAIDALDLKHSGNYASYVVGSYKNGLGQYVLKLDSSSDLDSVVWDEDHSVTNSLADNSPNNGKRVYFSDTDDTVYSAYVITNIDDTSTLYIRSLTDTSTHITHQIALNFTATSTPFIMPDYTKNNAPARKTLYLGDNQGNIHSAALLITGNTHTGDLKPASSIQTDINAGAVGALAATDTSPILYIGASTSSTTSGYYLRAQSDERLTVFKYKPSDSSWTRKWTTIVSGTAGKWTNGVFAADTSIQGLPTDSHITDEAVIVANSIVLPVTHARTGNACYGTAYYYLYKLTDGHFPSKVFTNNSDSSAIEGIITVGRGEAKTLHLVDIPGQDKLLGLGISPQKTDGTAGINTVININDPVTTGIRAWREIRE